MQIRIRDRYRAAPETVQRATHAFAAPIENMGIDHSRVFRLRPCRRYAFNKKIVSRYSHFVLIPLPVVSRLYG